MLAHWSWRSENVVQDRTHEHTQIQVSMLNFAYQNHVLDSHAVLQGVTMTFAFRDFISANEDQTEKFGSASEEHTRRA